MAINVNFGGNLVSYKCFDCLQLKNPEENSPTVVRIISGFTPQPNGQVQIGMGFQHVCPKCFKKHQDRYSELSNLQTIPVPKPDAIIDPRKEGVSTAIEQPPK